MTREQAEVLRENDKHWKLGIVYICREDPRFIVRNRWKFGWAWNFGSWKTVLFLPIFILIFPAPLFIFSPFHGSVINKMIAMTAVALLILVIIANYVASGPR